MILWIVKLLNTVRRAIAGRKYPNQLAWAVAFGLLLGIVPHGNLLAVALLIVVLSLKINHAMAGLTAIAATFVATKLDPFSHQVGDFVLSQPQVREAAVNAWQLPLIPWTDLNNTVVMGSFLIGVGALVPVFVITYPVFRLFQPAIEDDSNLVASGQDEPGPKGVDERSRNTETRESRYLDDASHEVVLVDHGHDTPAPHHSPSSPSRRSVEPSQTRQGSSDQMLRVDPPEQDGVSEDQTKQIAVETRIDVIRMSDYQQKESDGSVQATVENEDNQPMDEALNYLLRQLRDSQQRKAA